jgi:hypothetical protein
MKELTRMFIASHKHPKKLPRLKKLETRVQQIRLGTMENRRLRRLGILLAAHDRLALPAHHGGGDFHMHDVGHFRHVKHQIQH